MRQLMVLLILVCISAPALAQGNFAILAKGIVPVGQPRFMDDNIDLRNMTAANFSPGALIRFNQDGRITFGLDYERGKLVSEPMHITTHQHPQTGAELTFADVNSTVRNDSLYGTMAVNLFTTGKIRPFIEGGGGVNRIRQTYTIKTFVDPSFQSVFGHDFKFDVPDSYSEQSLKPGWKALLGVNVFPTRFLVVSASAGWRNGKTVEFAIGLTR